MFKTLLLASLLLAAPAMAEDAPHTLTVSGLSEQQFAPDKADIIVVVEGRSAKLADAKAEHDKKLAQLLALQNRFNLKKSDIKTLSDSVQPEYDYNDGKQKLREYVASHRLQITLHDTKQAGSFVNAVVGENINRVESVSYGLEDNAKAQNTVLLAAIEDAKQKAETAARALGVKLNGVHSFTAENNGVAPRPPMPMMAMARMKDAAPEATPLPEGDVSLQQTVSVSYLIEN